MLRTAALCIALIAGGCFTAAGAVTGGAVAASKIQHGEDTSYGASVATGAVMGLIVDVALTALVISSIDTRTSEPTTPGCFGYCGPGGD
jgi:hypothetical protein